MEERPRSPARLLAPIALIGFAFALFVTVTGSEVQDEEGSTSTVRQENAGDAGRERTRTDDLTPEERREAQLPDEVYVVKAGDTLAAISQKTGLTIEELEELNPTLDPQALVSGQQIKLRE